MTDQQPRDWADALAARVGRRVAELRAWRGWSAQQLSDRLALSGYEIRRGTIAHLENGRRNVSVPDLFALAWAFDVPPMLLLFDPLNPDAFAYLPPGVDEYRLWDFLGWWVGDEYPSPSNRPASGEWAERRAVFRGAMEALERWRELEEAEENAAVLLNELSEVRHRLSQRPGDEALARAEATIRAAYLAAIKTRDSIALALPLAAPERRGAPPRRTDEPDADGEILPIDLSEVSRGDG